MRGLAVSSDSLTIYVADQDAERIKFWQQE
jgi:hypothetical protein